MIGHVGAEAADRHVEFEHQPALRVLGQQALDPEERRDALAAGDRGDLVQAGAGIQDQISGRELDAVAAIGIFDDQFAAVVVLRRAQEQGGRQVGAHRVHAAAAAVVADRVVDVEAERLAAGVAVEQRRVDPLRQRGGEEGWVLRQRVENERPEFARDRIVFRQLRIVLGLGRLMAGGDASIGPAGLLQARPAMGDLFGGEDLGDVQQHGFPQCGRPGGPGRCAWTVEVRLEREPGVLCHCSRRDLAQKAKLALSTNWRPSPGVAQPLLRMRVKYSSSLRLLTLSCSEAERLIL